jgi:hypothetical protein
MSPSILQLQSLGIQDVYLTHKPEINLFRYSYYRYANFATETIKLQMSESAQFGKRSSCIIQKRGHLLSKMYLHIKLPQLTPSSGTYLSWCDTIGYGIFAEPIELEIGGVVVERIYPRLEDILDEFTHNTNQQDGKNLMILKSDNYVSTIYNATKPVDLVIPLNFWFTKDYQTGFPLIGVTRQEIKINFKLRPFSECVNYDGADPNEVSIIDSEILAEYIYVDDSIAEQMLKQKYQYIIDQSQYNGDEFIPSNTSIVNADIKFNHPVKEIYFGCVTTDNIENNNHFVYSDSNDDPIISQASLLLDGKRRFELLDEAIYRLKYPFQVHSVISSKYIYIMPFALKPEHIQPTGSINMSTFNDITLSLKMRGNNPDCFLFVFAKSYNVITIENGILTMEFAS